MQLSYNILTESQDNGADGGEGGPLQDEHGDDVKYKMVLVVVVTCKTDIANFSYVTPRSSNLEILTCRCGEDP